MTYAPHVRRFAGSLVMAVLPAAAVAQGARVAGQAPEIVTAADIDPRKEINFASGVWPSRVYVGQQVTYQIGIFLSEEMRSRLRSNPQFVPPDVRSMIAYDLPVPARLYQRRAGERTYDVHVFSRALFPLAAGPQQVPPARLTYAVPLSNSIFSREESHTARTSAHALVVVDPPAGGRPAEYLGAVGRLSVRARVDASNARVGDPLLLTLTVSGVGNVGLFPRPGLVLPWGHAVAGTERVRVDSSAPVIAGDKEFDWVITPRVAGTQEVPALRYPYFNPYTEQYEVAITPPLGIRVRPGALAAPGGGGSDVEPRLTLRRTLRGDTPAPWPAQPWFWAGLVLAPIPAAWSRWRRRPRLAPIRSPRRQLETLARAAAPDPREVRRLATAALAERIPVARTHPLGDGSALERTLRRAGVSVGTAREARRLFAALDELAYAANAPPAPGIAGRVAGVLEDIDREATPVAEARARRLRAGRTLVLVAILAGGGAWLGAQADDDHATFAAGLAAYDSGNAPRARDLFAGLASRRPRSADAWANLGTTAWHAGDTAQAVVGWQRALRLEPLAGDARARLGRTPSFRDGLAGDIPPVPVNLVAALGALLWLAGWGASAGAHRARRRQGLVLLASASIVALATLGLSERLRGDRAVVVLAADRLREAPAVGARPGAVLLAGETGRVVASQGAWVRARFADAREGWIDAGRLASLELPPAR